jgi:hypothetical protein
MLLLVLTSNEQETRVLLVLVFLMMTKPRDKWACNLLSHRGAERWAKPSSEADLNYY